MPRRAPKDQLTRQKLTKSGVDEHFSERDTPEVTLGRSGRPKSIRDSFEDLSATILPEGTSGHTLPPILTEDYDVHFSEDDMPEARPRYSAAGTAVASGAAATGE
jgi:hypothetical protein